MWKQNEEIGTDFVYGETNEHEGVVIHMHNNWSAWADACTETRGW